MGDAADFDGGVGWARGETDRRQHRQVGKIVADITDLARVEAEIREQWRGTARPCWCALNHGADAEFRGAAVDHRGARPERIATRLPAFRQSTIALPSRTWKCLVSTPLSSSAITPSVNTPSTSTSNSSIGPHARPGR